MKTKDELEKEYIERKTKNWDTDTYERYVDNVREDFREFYAGYLQATKELYSIDGSTVSQ